MRFLEIPPDLVLIPDGYIPVLHRAQTCEVIKLTGVIMPIVVKQIAEQKYMLVDGYERLMCAKKNGMQVIPAVVLEENENMPEALSFALNYVRGRYTGIDVLLNIWQLSTSKPDNVLAVLLGRSAETVRKYRSVMDKLLMMGIGNKEIEELRVQKIPLKKIIMCAGESENRDQFMTCIFGKPRKKLQEIPPSVISIAKDIVKNPELQLAAEVTKSIGADKVMALFEAMKIVKDSCSDLSKLVGCASPELIRALKTLCREAEKI